MGRSQELLWEARVGGTCAGPPALASPALMWGLSSKTSTWPTAWGEGPPWKGSFDTLRSDLNTGF